MKTTWPPKCVCCGRFVSLETGRIDPPRYVYTADYWNGPDEVIDAWCEKHLPKE